MTEDMTTDQSSILERVLDAQISHAKEHFNPVEVVGMLLARLTSRESQILRMRFGLDGSDPKTLEAIGTAYNITRERVRQIEKQGVSKIKALKDFDELIKPVANLVIREIRMSGGLIPREDLIEELKETTQEEMTFINCMYFIISELLKELSSIYPF